MRILVDIGHAAHVHLFKRLVHQLTEEGHDVTVVSRAKPHVLDLLKAEKIEHRLLSAPGKGIAGLLWEWIRRTSKINALHREIGFDVAIGTSVSIPFLSLRHSVISINVQEDDDAVVPFHAVLAYPFSTWIMNPECLQYRLFKKKRVLHSSLHEMAYLHPKTFSPDPSVLEKYRLEKYGYIVVRKVALTAHHDRGESGLSKKHIDVVREKFPLCDLVLSNESKQGIISVEDMHSVMAFSRLVLADSQTMTAEAACLGVPVIRVSSFKGRLSYLNLLDAVRYSRSIAPDDLAGFSYLMEAESMRQIYDSERAHRRRDIGRRFPDFTQIMKYFIYEICDNQ